VHAKDVMRTLEDEGNLRALRAQVRADDVIREVLTVPKNRRVDAVLQNLQDRRLRMAIVIHEWGSFEGIITMEEWRT
jgi:CBS domain containing-hemolysin-like protein